jgi:hypothetical protein
MRKIVTGLVIASVVSAVVLQLVVVPSPAGQASTSPTALREGLARMIPDRGTIAPAELTRQVGPLTAEQYDAF